MDKSIPLDMGCKIASKSDLLILSASSVVNGTWQRLADSAHVDVGWLGLPLLFLLLSTRVLALNMYWGDQLIMSRSLSR